MSNISLRPTAKAADSYDLLIYGDVGESWFSEGTTGKMVADQLAKLPASTKTLNIKINSFGGSVAEGFAIHNAIRGFAGRKVAIVEGVACSIASLIAMAADEVQMHPQSLFMVHAPWSGGSGNANDLRKTADVLDKFAASMVTAYTRKTGRPEAEITALLTDGEDHWYTAQEAVDAKFADTILDDSSTSKSAKAALDKAPMATRQMAMAAFRGVTPFVQEQETEMTVNTETKASETVEVQAAVDAAAVQAKAIADAVAAARVQIEAEAQAKVDAAQAAVVEAQARLGAEIEAKEIAACVAEAKTVFANLPGKLDDIAIAVRAARKADPASASVLETALRAASALLADGTKSQTEAVGNTVTVDATELTAEAADKEVEALAKVKMASNAKLTLQQARSQVYTERKDLVAVMRGEKD